MDKFPAGTDAVIEITYTDNVGDPVTPTGLSYRVTDGWGDQVVPPTVINDLSGTSTEITVPASALALPGGYQVELTINVGSKVYTILEIFGVVPVVKLEFLKNTFQSIAHATYLSSQIPNLVYFMGADREDQEIALMEAFRRLTLLNFVIPWPEATDMQNRIRPDYESRVTPRMWPLMTPDLFRTYPQVFRDALSRAQIVEANALMTFDPTADRRRAGVFSEKIGESSIMFKSGVRPLDEDTASRAALNILAPYLSNRITITRS